MRHIHTLNSKIYKVGTSRTTYLLFAIISGLLLCVILFIKPSIFIEGYGIPLITVLYGLLLLLFSVKGEKLIINNNQIQLKGWFFNKKMNLSEIDSYKIMSSSYTGNNKVITIIPKDRNRKDLIINSFPYQDSDEFINWLENKLEKNEALNIDSSQQRIIQDNTKFNINVSNQELGLKIFRVGASYSASVFLIFLFILAMVALIFLLELGYINHYLFMYIQTIGGIVFMVFFIAYTMFFREKLIISKDSLRIKGLYSSRELKFHEIKGFKTIYTPLLKRYLYIVIIPNTEIRKEIIIRPTGKKSDIELTDWINKNLQRI